MKSNVFYPVILVIFLSFFYFGCKDSITADQLDSVVIPDSNVSYSQYIQPVFNLKCINCHGNGQVSGGLNLTTWSGAVADPSAVFPYKPDNSSLVWAIKGISSNPMPPSGVTKPLNKNQVDGIVTWIKEGAKNN